MILGLAVMLAIGCKGRMSMPDMSETFGRKDSRPFGGQIALAIAATRVSVR